MDTIDVDVDVDPWPGLARVVLWPDWADLPSQVRRWRW